MGVVGTGLRGQSVDGAILWPTPGRPQSLVPTALRPSPAAIGGDQCPDERRRARSCEGAPRPLPVAGHGIAAPTDSRPTVTSQGSAPPKSLATAPSSTATAEA